MLSFKYRKKRELMDNQLTDPESDFSSTSKDAYWFFDDEIAETVAEINRRNRAYWEKNDLNTELNQGPLISDLAPSQSPFMSESQPSGQVQAQRFFSCTQEDCGKTFKNKKELVRHLLRHPETKQTRHSLDARITPNRERSLSLTSRLGSGAPTNSHYEVPSYNFGTSIENFSLKINSQLSDSSLLALQPIHSPNNITSDLDEPIPESSQRNFKTDERFSKGANSLSQSLKGGGNSGNSDGFNANEYLNEFQESLRKLGLYMKMMEKDGNCMFRSIADQVKDDQEQHDYFRQLAVNYLGSNKEDFKGFITMDTDKDFEAYLSNMAKSSTWGTHLELYALSATLQARIFVHTRDSRPIIIEGGQIHYQKTLHIAYHRNQEHYDSVRRLDKMSDLPTRLVYTKKGLLDQRYKINRGYCKDGKVNRKRKAEESLEEALSLTNSTERQQDRGSTQKILTEQIKEEKSGYLGFELKKVKINHPDNPLEPMIESPTLQSQYVLEAPNSLDGRTTNEGSHTQVQYVESFGFTEPARIVEMTRPPSVDNNNMRPFIRLV